MAYTIPSIEPEQIIVGDTVLWTKSLSDFPADEFTLSYAFTDSAGNQFAVTAVADGTDHAATISKATSGGFVSGDYKWQSYATDISTTERFSVAQGRTTVIPNYSAAAVDDRTFAKKALDALEAAIEGRASETHLAQSIAGRSVQEMSLEEQLVARDKLRAEVRAEENAERIANGLGSPNVIRTRF